MPWFMVRLKAYEIVLYYRLKAYEKENMILTFIIIFLRHSHLHSPIVPTPAMLQLKQGLLNCQQFLASIINNF